MGVSVGLGVAVGSGVGVAVDSGVGAAATTAMAVGVLGTGCADGSLQAATSRAAATAQTKTTLLMNILDERISRIIAYESHTYAALTKG